MKLVLATHNPGKIREFSQMASGLDIELLPMPDDLDPEETGSTFLENAIIKACAAAQATNLPAVADDSGLEIEALDGRPGIRSARYVAGSDADRRLKILEEMSSVPEEKRQAAFVCAMALCSADGKVLNTTEQRWHGSIGYEERGQNGFGYDPIFNLADRDETSAMITNEEKNTLSHRGQAWRKMLEFIRSAEISV
ncbi:MAG: non-canonical purine NTP pyrophosphatase, RdgB/HAM1 family [Cyanobacteria bacterium PR.3.49]|nr:non-canonical purine NTP pyrophosphatase, RdgB/HAM1 family [Cyanobacteria bacterium PR.3.49]